MNKKLNTFVMPKIKIKMVGLLPFYFVGKKAGLKTGEFGEQYNISPSALSKTRTKYGDDISVWENKIAVFVLKESLGILKKARIFIVGNKYSTVKLLHAQIGGTDASSLNRLEKWEKGGAESALFKPLQPQRFKNVKIKPATVAPPLVKQDAETLQRKNERERMAEKFMSRPSGIWEDENLRGKGRNANPGYNSLDIPAQAAY